MHARPHQRRFIVLIVVAAVVVIGLGYSLLKTPLYRSTTQVAPYGGLSFSSEGTGPSEGALANEARRVTSIRVRQVVRAEFGVGDEAVSTTIDPSAKALEIHVVSESSQRAREISVAYAEAYGKEQAASSASDIVGTIEVIKERVAQLEVEIDAVDPASQEEETLSNERTSLVGTLANLERSMTATRVQADIRNATTTTTPVSPWIGRNVTLVAIAAAGAWLLFRRDQITL